MARKQTKKFIGGWVSKELKAKLQAHAEAQDRPLQYVIEKILSEGVKHLEQTEVAA